MARMKPLSIPEKVLVHLSKIRFDADEEILPDEISQSGIAENVGISRTHVPRAVKELIKVELVSEGKGYTRSGKKRMKIYLITPKGMAKVREIEERLMGQIMPVKIQNTIVQGMTLGQIEKAFHRKIDLFGLAGDEEFLDLDSQWSSGIVDLADSPKPSDFLDREDELEQIKHFLKSRARILVVYGARGMGTSSLVRYFTDLLSDVNILWISMARNHMLKAMEKRLETFAGMVGASAQQLLESRSDALIVFDGYFDVEEEVVEFFSDLVERQEGARLIITCRDSTPSYSRFYRKEHVDADIVREMTVRGLTEAHARRLLGNEGIPEEAFGRIFALSRGSPMILRMLRERDEDGLRKNTTFTNEEIRFLLTESAAKRKEI